jgi:hypothetical protein
MMHAFLVREDWTGVCAGCAVVLRKPEALPGGVSGMLLRVIPLMQCRYV